MKRPKVSHHKTRTSKVACTVSAAALMLGVSQAATVGLHFQLNYCGAPSYSGFAVTMTAFGIAPGSWENLMQMDTGYGSCTPAWSGPYTLMQIVDTTTSSGGLNPLPNGSLTVTWSANSANFSGFAGYGGNPPSYDYDGQPPTGQNPPIPFPTGEWEVYSSFLRDGINFGPNLSNPGGPNPDNNQPGYTVDVTGLKSLFTNNTYVVELIAASDSMQTITNVFIIDATAGTTNYTVSYPSIPFPSHDEGGAPWYRGHGGGLSTVSGALNTDHLKIIGNRAQHGTNATTGFDNASTISGFIVTDKPVISMSPHQVLVAEGDTVNWSAYAIGVPPLTYQWRKNGVAISGATTSALGITNVTIANIGTYDLQVTNLYGIALSAPVTIGDKVSTAPINNLVLDSNPKGPQHNGLNNGATWLASSTDGASVTRTGVMSFSAIASNQITIAGETNFDTGTGTIMFWMRSSGVTNPGSTAALFDRLNKNGCLILQNSDGTLGFQAEASTVAVGTVNTTNTLSDNHWHHFAVVFDQSKTGPLSGLLKVYVDGQPNNSLTISGDWSWDAGQELELGMSHDTTTWVPYNGLMDDVRVYSRGLNDAEVASAHTGALVDTNALLLQFQFDSAPGAGISLTWGLPNTVLQSADTITGPYTDLPGATSPYIVSVQAAAKFYRYRHTPVVIIANPFLM